jgi:hypothetical protein
LGTGLLHVEKGYRDLTFAQENSDVTGVALAGLQMAKGSVKALGGAIYIPSLSLSLAAQSTSNLAVALVGLGKICLNANRILSGITLGIKSYELQKFCGSLDAIINDPDLSQEERSVRALEFLKQEIAASPENRAFVQRVISGKCINMVQEKGPSEANSVIAAIERELKVKIVLSAIGAVCIALLLLPLVVTLGPLVVGVTEVVSLLVSLLWLVMNSHHLYRDLQESVPGRLDQLWILFSSMLSVMAVNHVFFFSTGIRPLITAATAGAVWFAVNASCQYRLHQLTCRES